jgi:uncharacterized membrane protein YhfC
MNSVLIFTYPLGIIAVLVLVIGLGVFLTRKYNLGWRLYWIGAGLFIISQILHVPFNFLVDRLFRTGVLATPPEEYQLLFNAVFLGLSAGLFEELVRYAGLRWWAKNARTWAKGLLLGSGWGAIEAIIFYVLVLSLNYIVFLALRTQDLSSQLSPAQYTQLQEGMNLFWSVSWYDSLLGAVERIFVLPVQIALTILVLQIFTRRQSRWLWFAIAWHALLDAVTVISISKLSVYATEGLVGIFSIISIGIIFALRQPEPSDSSQVEDLEEHIDPPQVELSPVEVTPDKIEDTRYSD